MYMIIHKKSFHNCGIDTSSVLGLNKCGIVKKNMVKNTNNSRKFDIFLFEQINNLYFQIII